MGEAKEWVQNGIRKGSTILLLLPDRHGGLEEQEGEVRWFHTPPHCSSLTPKPCSSLCPSPVAEGDSTSEYEGLGGLVTPGLPHWGPDSPPQAASRPGEV